MVIPAFTHRSPNEIVTEQNFFESSGRAFRAISWIDYAKRNKNICALEYAALETRLAVEQLLFEQLIVGLGSRLDVRQYKKCSGNAKKLNEIIERLIPEYERLIDFTKAMAPKGLPITKWDNRALIEHSGKVSKYLHWSGGLDETIQSETWYDTGISTVEAAVNYIWFGLTTGNTGVMSVKRFEPEMREIWDLYKSDQITLDQAVKKVEIIEPILEARLARRASGSAE